ncbi:MAG: hypothetical protein ABL984_00775 [Pyrinomonadaceae bacterium]
MIEKIRDMLAFVVPVRVIRRADSLEVRDHRPTWAGFLAAVGFVVFAVAFVSYLLSTDIGIDSMGMWMTGVFTLGCLVVAFRGPIFESYYFDKTTNSYAFVRRYIYKRDVIEGGLDQFRAVRVHKHIEHDGERNTSWRYAVSLLQDGMTLGGGYEQPLREDRPILGTHANATRIGSAIAIFLAIPLHDTSD